jgi:hypothetical protein
MVDQQYNLYEDAAGDDSPRSRAPRDGEGRKPGALGSRRLLIDRYLNSNRLELMEALKNAALAGDPVAMKIVWDRIYPRPKAPAVLVDMPATETPDDLRRAMHDVMARVANGELAPEDGAAIVAMLRDTLAAHSIKAVVGPDEASGPGGKPAIEVFSARLEKIRAAQAAAPAEAANEPAKPPADPAATVPEMSEEELMARVMAAVERKMEEA